MGRLQTTPYAVADGREYVTYLAHVRQECARLVGEGRLPDSDELAGFLATAEQVVAQLRADVARAEQRGETTIASEIPMSASEHARMRNMNESFRNLLEILELRQALELNRTPAVARVAEAVQSGRYVD